MERDLGDPTNCLCLNLRKAARNLTRSYDAALAQCGLTTGQFATMLALKQMGPSPISAIAQAIDLERSALTRNLTVMEKNGLVQRIEGEDRRERIVTLSTEGEARLDESKPLWAKAQSNAVAELGKDASQRLLLNLAGFG